MDPRASSLFFIRSRALPPARKRGIALLLVITLLSFLVLLLVGLATYTRIETAVAGNMQRQTQARENALMALNVAIGQLQKNAGPDTRVTATAETIDGVNAQKLHYTGVWDSTVPGSSPVWLVSGVENGTAQDVTVAIPTASQIALVGTNTAGTGTANSVVVPLQTITAPGVPGQTGNAAIGKYAWWVGDQGVKAPVAVADASDTVTYSPFDYADLRSRIRQQVALGAGASDASGNPVFEPRDTNNASLVPTGKIDTPNQFPFLRNASNGTLGLTVGRANFHTWSANNFAVLANTKTGGLRQDLSLAPGLLGAAFTAWANYPAYMEKFVADPPVTNGEGSSTPATTTSTAPAILPAYGDDPVRRRYVMTPANSTDGATHSVAPVLSFFGMSFSIRESSTAAPAMEIAVRCVVTLWNPYTSALVPESLRVEVTGIPDVQIVDSAGGDHHFDTQRWLTGGNLTPMRFSLPWTTQDSDVDKNSWLPGRVYSWSAIENSTEPAEGNPMVFHYPDATPVDLGGEGIVRATSVVHDANQLGVTTPLTRTCQTVRPAAVQVQLIRAADDVVLATYKINLDPFGPTSPIGIANKYVDFAIIRRLPETDELPTGATEKWLSAATRDPRNPNLPALGLIGGKEGEDPGAYGGDKIIGFAVRDSTRLLDRAGDAYSYNEDVPVFELPRSPILSVGQLQHLQLADQRPFGIGNSWGSSVELNGIRTGELFDRFFFSGLVEGVVPSTTATGDLVLPNPSLRPLRKPDRSKVTIDDVRALMSPPTTTDADGNVVASGTPSSASSKFFLQGAAFNLNSVNATAWAAVLRGVRFPAPQSFSYLDVSSATGTADDATTAQLELPSAQFLRFSQSAQETYKAEPGMADNDLTVSSPANTHLFRKGMRTLSATEVAALAGKIVEWIKVKQVAADAFGGPFRSLDEFLAPSPLFSTLDADGNSLGARSLLEAAIADAGINGSIAEFSSQWLTQADIMTALAPVLFTRSDTFIVRTYGEALNPATGATEGRAWCEAMVQRVPEYLDGSADTGNAAEAAPDALTELNLANGRRFKVVSFRWLTRSDI